jgi:hypothetical protein
MSDHVEPLAKCVALYRRAALVLGEISDEPPSSLTDATTLRAIADRLREVCQQLERMLERCDQETIYDGSPFWAAFRSVQREVLTLEHALQTCRSGCTR